MDNQRVKQLKEEIYQLKKQKKELEIDPYRRKSLKKVRNTLLILGKKLREATRND